MGKQHYKPEQIISKLREAEVELGRGMAVPLVCKQLGITDSTYTIGGAKNTVGCAWIKRGD